MLRVCKGGARGRTEERQEEEGEEREKRQARKQAPVTRIGLHPEHLFLSPRFTRKVGCIYEWLGL